MESKEVSAVHIFDLVQTMWEEWKAVQTMQRMEIDQSYILNWEGTLEILVQEGEPFALLNANRWVQEMVLSSAIFLSDSQNLVEVYIVEADLLQWILYVMLFKLNNRKRFTFEKL